VFAFQVTAYVCSDATTLEEAFDRQVGYAHPEVLAHHRLVFNAATRVSPSPSLDGA
jgi:hypothetical protein